MGLPPPFLEIVEPDEEDEFERDRNRRRDGGHLRDNVSQPRDQFQGLTKKEDELAGKWPQAPPYGRGKGHNTK